MVMQIEGEFVGIRDIVSGLVRGFVWGGQYRAVYLREGRLELGLSGSFLLLLYSVSNSSAVPMMFRSGSQVESAVE